MRFIGWFLFLIAALASVAFAIANRGLVGVSFWPDGPPLELPVYLLPFAGLLLGILLGGIATWFGQGNWRKLARDRARETMRLERKVAELENGRS